MEVPSWNCIVEQGDREDSGVSGTYSWNDLR